MQKFNKGVTLVELMIVLAILVIVASIAIPAYQGYIKEGYYAEALADLKALQLEQQRLRSSCANYATDISTATSCSSRTIASVASSSNFNYDIEDETATSYTLVATGTGSMSGECACLAISSTVPEGVVATGSCPCN